INSLTPHFISCLPLLRRLPTSTVFPYTTLFRSDPVRRLDHGPRLVILDEVQKQPELLDSVKLLADSRKGHKFLLLGSSQILLLRSEEHTSELQSRGHLVCRLLLEKKNFDHVRDS